MSWWGVYCPNIDQYYAGNGTYVADFKYGCRYSSQQQAQQGADSLNQQGYCQGMNRVLKFTPENSIY